MTQDEIDARPVVSAGHLRLHMGELTANEVRIAQAAYRLVLAEMAAESEPRYTITAKGKAMLEGK